MDWDGADAESATRDWLLSRRLMPSQLKWQTVNEVCAERGVELPSSFVSVLCSVGTMAELGGALFDFFPTARSDADETARAWLTRCGPGRVAVGSETERFGLGWYALDHGLAQRGRVPIVYVPHPELEPHLEVSGPLVSSFDSVLRISCAVLEMCSGQRALGGSEWSALRRMDDAFGESWESWWAPRFAS